MMFARLVCLGGDEVTCGTKDFGLTLFLAVCVVLSVEHDHRRSIVLDGLVRKV